MIQRSSSVLVSPMPRSSSTRKWVAVAGFLYVAAILASGWWFPGRVCDLVQALPASLLADFLAAVTTASEDDAECGQNAKVTPQIVRWLNQSAK